MSAPSAAENSLADVARDVAVGAGSAGQLHGSLLTSTLYCERGERPGFTAWGESGSGLIAVFSSPEQLALARGRVPYFSLLGADLLDLLPPGYDLILDIAGEHPLRLSTSAVGRVATLEVTAAEGER